MNELYEQKIDLEKPVISPRYIPQSQDVTTKILDFLSTASNEKLGACALGLGVATYFILGRLGLILIGLLGGIILHSTWEGSNTRDDVSIRVETKRQKETSLMVIERLLKWEHMRQKPDTINGEATAITELTFDGFRPETASALIHLVDRVIEDYVR